MINASQHVIGKHAIIDLSGCDPTIIQNPDLINDILHRAARLAKVTVVGRQDHYFSPVGYSVVLVLEESHLSVHTWPEYNYISKDLFSCNLETDFKAVHDFLVEQFRSQLAQFTLLDRTYASICTTNIMQRSR